MIKNLIKQQTKDTNPIMFSQFNQHKATTTLSIFIIFLFASLRVDESCKIVALLDPKLANRGVVR
ncbi:hypothetical protein T4D_14842 [Trichinella pseudospiralis]|uniref:Uncharacterized protein n=1 Tax=Trichinella pseudospiralis TaxID=6337 RepID=A0A0V1FLC1_TRIPS|nr:hypothetical protein T4D_14842 [Trichinella pseudospiralis]